MSTRLRLRGDHHRSVRAGGTCGDNDKPDLRPHGGRDHGNDHGDGLHGTTTVNFGTTKATSFTVDSDTQITATSPAGTGVVDVTVVTPGGTSATSSADQFNYTPVNYTAVVTGITPAQGPVTGGTILTITGTGFGGATAVDFGSTKATSFTVVSDTQITATSPAGTGVVHVTVVTAGGTSATSSADQFSYQSSYAPVVTGITPAQGPVTGGTAVTITGTNLDLTSATMVKVGNSIATIYSDTGTKVVVITPAGTAGVVDVTVTTADGTSATSSVDQFTYRAATTAPTVTGVSTTQATGTYGAGTVIPITVTFSEPVTVTGTPLLNLAVNWGTQVCASYSGGSGTSTLTFTYTVEPDESSSDLDYAAVGSTSALETTDFSGVWIGSIQDLAGNPASLTLPPTGTDGLATRKIVIDSEPAVTGVSTTQATGTYGAGTAIPIMVTFTRRSG